MSLSALLAAGLAAGLVAGGLSCAVTQAGLLVSAVGTAPRARSAITPVLAFLAAKLVSHALLGAALGALGAVLQPAPLIRAVLNSAAGLGLAVVALRTYRDRRRCADRDPAGLDGMRSAVILGPATLFVPCGVTLAMEMVAVTTHSPLGTCAMAMHSGDITFR